MKDIPKIKNYRADIDGLRAVAVLLVLGYHVFPKLIKGGFVGVDIFFVISGYLITGIILNDLRNNTFSFATFFARRIKRIFPVLLLVLSVSYLAGWFILMPKEFKELSKHIFGGVAFVANFTLWQDSGYFDVLPELKPLMHLWSLSIEEQFYFIWPLGLYFAWKYRARLWLIFIGALLLSFVLNVFYISKKPDTVFYFPFFRFWELLIGALLALANFKEVVKLNSRVEGYLSWIGALLIIIATCLLDKNSRFPGWWALLPTIGTFLMIVDKSSWLNQKLLASKAFIWVGLISYPLYLWHWPIISYFYFSVGNMAYQVDRYLIIILSFLLSWLTYRFLETPLRHGKNTKKIIVGLIIASTTIGVVGVVTFKKDGFAIRMEKEFENMPIELKEMLTPDYGGYIGKNWREHSCFLAKGERGSDFKMDCIDSGKGPLIWIWGDSHAAAFYSGFKAYQMKKEFRIAQFTASACPPVLNWAGNINKDCKEINDYIFDQIKKYKPETVVLQAAWYWDEYDAKLVLQTIQALKEIAIKNIVLTGPSPTWKEKVPANMISYYRIFRKAPKGYTDFGLIDVEPTLKVDNLLEKIARDNNINFLSLFKSLCQDQACLLNTHNILSNVTSYDQGHLSETGALYVIENSENIFFQDQQNK